MKGSNNSPGYNRIQTDRVKTIHYAQDQDTRIDMREFLDGKLITDTCHFCQPKEEEDTTSLLTPSVKRHLPIAHKQYQKVLTCDKSNRKWIPAKWTRELSPPRPHQQGSCEIKPCIICARGPVKGLKPLMPCVERKYPYRYSSAGPTRCNATQKEKEVENALYIITGSDKSIKENSRPQLNVLLRRVELHPSFVTTSLNDSLRPFKYMGHHDRFLNKPLPPLPPGRGEPLSLNRRADTQFGQYVTDNLHPQFAWKKYPVLKRKYRYPMRKMDDTEFQPDWDSSF